MGKLIRCLTRDATVMALFLDSTDMVARAEQIHQPSAVVTAALGRLLTAASELLSRADLDLSALGFTYTPEKSETNQSVSFQ